MDTVIVILIVAGVIFVILSVVLVCVLWKYSSVKNKRVQSSGSFKGVKGQEYTDMSAGFEIPVSYQTVQAQTPFLAHEFDATKATVTAPSGSCSRRGSPIRTIDQEADSKSEKVRSIISLEDTWKTDYRIIEEKSKFESKSRFALRQEDISRTMMRHLIQKGRTVSSTNLHLHNIDDTHLSSKDRSGSETSLSSAGSFKEEPTYTSPTVWYVKRRLGKKRQGLGATNKLAYKKAGKIIFTTLYDQTNKMLVVHILRAFDLVPNRNVDEINPFVRLYLNPGKKQKQNTKYQKATKEPYINEKINFSDIDTENLEKYKLKVKVYNHGMITKSELLGEVDINLSAMDITLQETFDINLFLRKSETSLASVLISLSHQATFSKLEVIIQEAKNLAKRSGSKQINPLATVSFYKDDVIDKKETTTQWNSRNPTFNESLDFDVTTDFETPLTTYSLVVTLSHHSLVRSNEILGHVIFSLTSPQKSAADHWKAVQNAPHKRHTFWHSLIDPDEL